eukprot:CAMPEP_0202921204 /NCGR_PEP_ID=MMETSP1392-20130828/77266_1 /ASSEMBLY_ACC=CAM_ASM_000868 /TAXON_ID=225041 /ORGANISM="Chlamydomonas chlamydogama, Strain SAG 11-48b" /LENGTH=140 /DNA_ID=CAMNT_0049614753 /DNA_START=1058 /DNA_END=1480 /DNA_ORIENTATION=+
MLHALHLRTEAPPTLSALRTTLVLRYTSSSSSWHGLRLGRPDPILFCVYRQSGVVTPMAKVSLYSGHMSWNTHFSLNRTVAPGFVGTTLLLLATLTGTLLLMAYSSRALRHAADWTLVAFPTQAALILLPLLGDIMAAVV